jgi:peptidoglycan/LPS O-acetylase OafA/YrhL
MPVVLFHARVPGFGGGYVGVDVFFVISGYLITSLILSHQQRGEFTLAWFYERRIRRIFPAQFVMILFCVIAGWALMTPNDYRRLAGSIFATSVFMSNVLFWKRSGYFEPNADQQPLLHTWSLAVEEQFYLAFPIIVLLLVKCGRTLLLPAVVLLALTSFLVASILVLFDPISSFYLSPLRGWELLLGSLLAIGPIPSCDRDGLRNLLSVSGLGMILVAVFLYSKETLFPGISAILPTAGAAFVIWAGTNATPLANRFIASRPIVFMGQISYSLYLWHFVLLRFGSYLTTAVMTTLQTSIVLILSLLLAVLSWMFVEQPIRRTRFPLFCGRALFGVAGSATACLALIGLAIHSTNGFPERLTAEQRHLMAIAEEIDPDHRDCPFVTLQVARSRDFCKLGGDLGVVPSFMAWGDSHGYALRPALDATARRRGSVGLLASAPGCPPLIYIARMESEFRDCEAISQNVLRFILSEPSIKTVILIGRWGNYVEGVRYRDELERNKHVLVQSRLVSENSSTQLIAAAAFERTVSDLVAAGKRVWIVGPIPEIGIDVPRALYLKSLGIGRPGQIETTREEYNLRQAHVFRMIAAAARKYPIGVVWPDEVLCDTSVCMVAANGRSLYQDGNHLSKFGATLLEPVFEKITPSAVDTTSAADPS